jgi:hypothetical protein
MSDTIPIPIELYDDLVKVVNRLQACRSVETSKKEVLESTKPPSKKTRIYNKFKTKYENL